MTPPPPLRRVSVGLSLVAGGTLAVALCGLLIAADSFDVINYPFPSAAVLTAALFNAFAVVFAGRFVVCLALPPSATAARAWAVLAAVLDGCGLVCGLTAFLLDVLRVGIDPLATMSALLFATGGLVLGRVAFMVCLLPLARFVGRPELAGRVRALFWYAASIPAVTLSAFGVVVIAVGGRVMSATTANLLANCMTALVLLACLHWAWRYVRLVVNLRNAARVYTPPPVEADDDPDRPYRERYEQGLIDDREPPADDRG